MNFVLFFFNMLIMKRDQRLEKFHRAKFVSRIKRLTYHLNNIDTERIYSLVKPQLYDKITSSGIDRVTANVCVASFPNQKEYHILAGRLHISNMHKERPATTEYKEFNGWLNHGYDLDLTYQQIEIIERHLEPNERIQCRFLKCLIESPEFQNDELSNIYVKLNRNIPILLTLLKNGLELNQSIKITHDILRLRADQ